uniref:Uncharacterized protein n=1 Tax=Anguilla anguilla TaxID=7936 RepID=A0A0E9Y0X4_ANGAN
MSIFKIKECKKNYAEDVRTQTLGCTLSGLGCFFIKGRK